MEPFPKEWQLLSFFECEPEVLDDGVPWAYNTLAFHTRRGSDDIRFKIAPGYETIEFAWFRDGAELLSVNLHWVRGIEVETGQGREVLTAFFHDGHLLPFVLRLKPTVHVAWGTNSDLP